MCVETRNVEEICRHRGAKLDRLSHNAHASAAGEQGIEQPHKHMQRPAVKVQPVGKRSRGVLNKSVGLICLSVVLSF